MVFSATNCISGSLFIKLISGGASFLCRDLDLSDVASTYDKYIITNFTADKTTDGF